MLKSICRRVLRNPRLWLVWVLGPAAAAAQFGPTLEAGELADAVAEVNAAGVAAAARAEAFDRAARAEGLWPDPQLMVEASNLPAEEMTFDRTPMSGWQLYLRQTIPLPGKNTYRRRAAEGGAGAAAADAEAVRLRLVERAKYAYLDLYLASALREITAQQLAWWSDYERIALARYAAGRGLQADVLNAQLERTRPRAELLKLERRAAAARGRVNVLLNREPEAELPPLAGLPEVVVPYSREELVAKALASHPSLRAAEERMASAEAGRSLAKLSYVPDVTAGVGYRLRAEVPMDPVAGEDFWSFSAGVSLPLVGTVKRGREAARAEAAVRAAEASRTDARNEVLWQLEDLAAAVATAEEEIPLYEEGILPQAEAAARSTLAAYEAGKVDFASVLRTRLALYRFEKEYVELQVRRHQAIASLEALVGERFY
ncbi:MAG: TolC family protein [Candidatus Coatesbacteria bacterium]|nr:MAG: TolC family protein [Candidatus Coatesbacteria bacterium]